MLLFWDGEGKPVYGLFPTKRGIIFYCTSASCWFSVKFLTSIFIYALPGLYKWPFLKLAAAFKVIKISFYLFNIILFLMASDGLGTALLWCCYGAGIGLCSPGTQRGRAAEEKYWVVDYFIKLSKFYKNYRFIKIPTLLQAGVFYI
jgi:hypothetical protein